MKKMILVFLVTSLLVNIKATDVDIYGKISTTPFSQLSVRFWNDFLGNDPNNNYEPVYGKDSLPAVLINDWMASGFFGTKFKVGDFGGCIELAITKNIYDAILAGNPTVRKVYEKEKFFVSIRKWYGEWYLSDLITFLAGQNLAITCFTQSNKKLWYEEGFNNFGCLYSGPQLMFQLAIHAPNYPIEWKIAAMKTDTTYLVINNLGPETGIDTRYQCESKSPKLEVGFSGNLEADLLSINTNIAGGYQKFSSVCSHEAIPKDQSKVDFDSYVLGVDLGVTLGPVSFIYDMFMGQNLGIYGINLGPKLTWWRQNDFQYVKMYYPKHDSIMIDDTTANWMVFNSRATQMAWIVGYKPFQWLALECGYGAAFGNHEYKEWDDKWQKALWRQEDPYEWRAESYSWYTQMEFSLFELLKVTPEWGQYVFGRYKGFGKFYYWALKMEIDF